MDKHQSVLQWLCIWISQLTLVTAYFSTGFEPGCADGKTSGLQNTRHPWIVACQGEWRGHVENASSLCASGWKVCSPKDQRLLKQITWKDAMGLPGCYAINAAQDGGACNSCKSDVNQDDLGGIGKGCPHQNFGENSCITGGKIDVSCCTDTHFDRACQYRPGLTTGVVCCKQAGIPPNIFVKPHPTTHVTSGVTFVLSCQAMGTPSPEVTWLKDGQIIPDNETRISIFTSGYLLISEALPTDTGQYECRAENFAGSDSARALVIVTDYKSGCADGNTDGLYKYEDIQACKGSWEGHVKRGKSLCARGWHVCSNRHEHLLNLLSWSDIMQLDGCYAYNAMNIYNTCQRCHRDNMAGIGNTCGKINKFAKSCLAQGQIDVLKGRPSKGQRCKYIEGVTTGVMCCKKTKKLDNNLNWDGTPKCSPRCDNGGKCIAGNRCKCQPGYKGAWCQNPICKADCIPNSSCVRPGVCRCNSGYTYSGAKCVKRSNICNEICLNGGRCRNGRCKCPKSHRGSYCQHENKWKDLIDQNRTER